MANYWYAYKGEGDPIEAGSYRKMSALPGCLNGPSVCAIYAEGDGGGRPDAPLSTHLVQYITNALGTLLAQPQDNGTAKKFVYMKPRA